MVPPVSTPEQKKKKKNPRGNPSPSAYSSIHPKRKMPPSFFPFCASIDTHIYIYVFYFSMKESLFGFVSSFFSRFTIHFGSSRFSHELYLLMQKQQPHFCHVPAKLSPIHLAVQHPLVGSSTTGARALTKYPRGASPPRWKRRQ